MGNQEIWPLLSLRCNRFIAAKSFSFTFQIRQYDIVNAIHLFPANSLIHSLNKYLLSIYLCQVLTHKILDMRRKRDNPYNPGVGEEWDKHCDEVEDRETYETQSTKEEKVRKHSQQKCRQQKRYRWKRMKQ